MKDYLKINRAYDEKNLRDVISNMELLKKKGDYPEYLTYPTTLQFELTGKCNLACRHCYNRSGDLDRKSDEYTLMTPEKWCNLAYQIVRDGGIFQCIISGGEPLLLGDGLFKIMDILHNDGTSFVVITNGYLLTPEVAKKFKKYRFYWFQISIDGVNAAIHDEFRGVKGSWERAVRGAMEISGNGIPLVIAHSVTPKSMPDMDAMVQLSYELGASSIIMGEILPSGRAYENPDTIFSREQRNEFYGKIFELQQKYAGKIEIRRSAELRTQLKRYSVENNAGGIIRPNGDFRLDCMAPFVIGNVFNESIKDIWLKKGIGAWKIPEVTRYLASIDEDGNTGWMKNHVERDIYL